jgi:protein SCO1/2
MAAVCVLGGAVNAQDQDDSEFTTDIPDELVGVTITEHLDEILPLDLEFTDEQGEPVKLADYFQGEQPVILQMGYYRCPMLCNLVLNEAISGLSGVEDLSAGKDYKLLSVSVNPSEGPELAKVKREGYLLEYNREGASRGFHFLVGSAENSKALADAVGFQYRLQPDGEYAHAAALFIITPDGRISRYLYGVGFEPRTLRFALMEGAEGRIGSTLQRFILWCHIYDPDSGSYVLLAFRIMQLGGIITLFLLVSGVGWLWLRDRDRSLPLATPDVQPIHESGGPVGGKD